MGEAITFGDVAVVGGVIILLAIMLGVVGMILTIIGDAWKH